MRTARAFCLLGIGVGVALAFSGCGGDDDSGGGGKGGADAGKESGSGGIGGIGGGGGKGGTGGSGAKDGGTGGSGGCLPAPNTGDPGDCDICQDEQHAGCACEADADACFNDADCFGIYECTFQGTSGGVGPCLSLDADGAACVHTCLALFPAAARALYLKWEKCVYCSYCGSACGTTDYCAGLDNPPDGGVDGGSDGGVDATTDVSSDVTASDAPDDGASEATNEAGDDGATDAPSDATSEGD